MTPLKDDNLFYQEVQQFRQPWLWLVLLFSSSLSLYTGFYPFLAGRRLATEPVQEIVLFLFGMLFGLGFPLLFLTCKLIAEVRHDGIYISFPPFLFFAKKIPLSALRSYAVRTYRPLREYGGWGIRYGANGKAFNVSGNRGVQLELIGGEKILIGSRSPEALASAIAAALDRQN